MPGGGGGIIPTHQNTQDDTNFLHYTSLYLVGAYPWEEGAAFLVEALCQGWAS